MSVGGIFSAVKNSITARYLNRTSSQPSLWTGTESDLRIAMGSRVRMVGTGGGCHMTAWSRFHPVFFSLIKKYGRRGKTFQPALLLPYTYYRHFGHTCCLQLLGEATKKLHQLILILRVHICYFVKMA
jgi:hypothetical protein